MERTIEEIQKEIDNLKEELANVRGRQTEVYARIVGYYRSVRNWNKGKREEYNHRKLFNAQNSMSSHPANVVSSQVVSQESSSVPVADASSCSFSKEITFKFFMRKTCPNCPPVKAAIEASGLSGIFVDVDTPQGLELASELAIFAAPTVVFFDANGIECYRARSANEISSFLSVKEEVSLAV